MERRLIARLHVRAGTAWCGMAWRTAAWMWSDAAVVPMQRCAGMGRVHCSTEYSAYGLKGYLHAMLQATAAFRPTWHEAQLPVGCLRVVLLLVAIHSMCVHPDTLRIPTAAAESGLAFGALRCEEP